MASSVFEYTTTFSCCQRDSEYRSRVRRDCAARQLSSLYRQPLSPSRYNMSYRIEIKTSRSRNIADPSARRFLTGLHGSTTQETEQIEKSGLGPYHA